MRYNTTTMTPIRALRVPNSRHRRGSNGEIARCQRLRRGRLVPRQLRQPRSDGRTAGERGGDDGDATGTWSWARRNRRFAVLPDPQQGIPLRERAGGQPGAGQQHPGFPAGPGSRSVGGWPRWSSPGLPPGGARPATGVRRRPGIDRVLLDCIRSELWSALGAPEWNSSPGPRSCAD